MKTASETKKPSNRRRRAALHRFLHLCASGTQFMLAIQQSRRGEFGSFTVTVSRPVQPDDVREYRVWLASVQRAVSDLQGRHVDLDFYEPQFAAQPPSPKGPLI